MTKKELIKPFKLIANIITNVKVTAIFLLLTLISALVWLFFDLPQLEPVTVILGVFTASISAFSFIKKRKKLLIVISILGIILFIAGIIRIISPYLFSEKNQTQQNEAYTLNVKGNEYYNEGKYDLALDFFNKALVIMRAIGDKAGEGITLNNIGTVYKSQGKYDLALDFFNKALVIGRTIGDVPGEGATLNNIGGIYQFRGEYDLALDYYNKALSIYQSIGEVAGEGTALTNIGGIYETQGKYGLALDFFNKALVIMRTIEDKQNEQKILAIIESIQK